MVLYCLTHTQLWMSWDNNLNILFDSDICLTPNLISSRLVCNCIQPLTKKIHKDGLLVHSLNEIDLSQKTSFDLKYKFQDKTVEKIYGVILSCYRFLSITFQGNIIYLINRYYHYFGNDANLCNLKTKYSEWSRSLSEFCKLLVCKIVRDGAEMVFLRMPMLLSYAKHLKMNLH